MTHLPVSCDRHYAARRLTLFGFASAVFVMFMLFVIGPMVKLGSSEYSGAAQS